jgi:penicillin-binding protein 2
MATLARNGLYKDPKLFIEEQSDGFDWATLDISRGTIDTVRDGMFAVVNEQGGTAQKAFADTDFGGMDVRVYGKTGSTQAPENAWFAGWAEDSEHQAVAVAVVVEGGQHGSSDAAPLARQMLLYCIERGYLGQKPPEEPEAEKTEN